MRMRLLVLVVLLAPAPPAWTAEDSSPAAAALPSPPSGRWERVLEERFDALQFSSAAWRPEDPAEFTAELPEDAKPLADDGASFRGSQGSFTAPPAFRVSAPFGAGGALTLEAYSRQSKDLGEMVHVVDDPSAPGNRVLRLASPEHTDGVLVRTSQPLGARYQVCARVGHIDFGTGDGDNGYDGDEDAGPWVSGSAVGENGCYFGAIYRARPAPHNNLLAHRLRLAFIDSDNNLEGWSQIWVPGRNFFVPSGWHPVVLGAVVGHEAADAQSGPPFMTHAADGWNTPGRILAADGYGDGRWYDVCFARFDGAMAMSVDGEFRYGGRRAYVAALPDADTRLPGFDGPHYWLSGDPHINYYEGAVLIDDVRISVWRDAP